MTTFITLLNQKITLIKEFVDTFCAFCPQKTKTRAKFCICALIIKHAAVSENNEGKKAKEGKYRVFLKLHNYSLWCGDATTMKKYEI